MAGSTPRPDPTDPRGTLAYVTGQVVLDHVADEAQLMYSEGNTQVADWGTGDLAGLHALGTGDCLPEL